MTGILHISVLGPTGVTLDGVPIVLRSVRQRRLLACLVLHRPATVSADRLVDALWAEALPADPSAALQNQIGRLRANLGPGGARILTVQGGYRLDGQVACDVAEFEEMLASAREQADPGARAEILERAVSLWRGFAYEELDSDDARPEATRLGELRLAAREDHGAALLAAGEPAGAVALLERLCSDQPLREHARLLLAEALVAVGRRSDALRTLDDLRRRLVVDLSLDPSPALVDLERVILDGGSRCRPARLAPGPGPRLPVFGRDQDVLRLEDALATSRIVTVVGPGGVGKTTLALLVAERVAPRYEYGVAVVDLTTAGGGGDVPRVFARDLGIDREPGADWTERIHEALISRTMLVVVDNAEHVVADAAQLIADLAGQRPCRLLVTSREPLGVPGERIVPVEPLMVEADPESPAIALFVDRARAVRTDWSLGAETLDVVAGICKQLDGLPLAIEMAASQLRFRTLVEISARLDRPLDLPGAIRGHRRQRSLRGVFEWSYDLLEPTQRAVFDRLAVFTGGFTVESAQQVCDDVVGDAPVERVLDDLVVRSLLRRHDRPYGTRYRMLEVIRLFADEHLTPLPRHDQVADAHAQAMVRQLERVRHEVFGPDEAVWAAWFDDERANVLTAHRRLIDRCRVASSLGLAVASYLLSFPRARADIDTFPSEALAGLDGCDHSTEGLQAVLAEALGLAADAAVHAGDTERAEQLIARGVGLGRSAPGADRFCLSVAADLALFRGDTSGAATLYEEAEAGCLEWDEPSLAAWMAASAALARSYQGHADDQVGAALRALERAEHLGSPSVRGFCRYVLGEVIATRDPNESKRQLQSAVVDAESVGASFIAGLARLSLATDAARRGEPSAVGLYRILVDLWQRTGRWTQQWITIRSLAVMLGERGRPAEAVTLLTAVRANDPHTPWGSDSIQAERCEARCRAALATVAYDEASTRGRSLPKDEVPAFALAALGRLASIDVPADAKTTERNEAEPLL